jgi:hypothetical protein
MGLEEAVPSRPSRLTTREPTIVMIKAQGEEGMEPGGGGRRSRERQTDRGLGRKKEARGLGSAASVYLLGFTFYMSAVKNERLRLDGSRIYRL